MRRLRWLIAALAYGIGCWWAGESVEDYELIVDAYEAR